MYGKLSNYNPTSKLSDKQSYEAVISSAAAHIAKEAMPSQSVDLIACEALFSTIVQNEAKDDFQRRHTLTTRPQLSLSV